MDRHDGFDPPFTTLNVGVIKGGSAKNVIPGECRFTLEWRPIPTQKPNHVLDLLNTAIEDEIQRDPDFRCEVSCDRNDSGFETELTRHWLPSSNVTGKKAGSVAFGTEGAQMTILGSETVVLGPGDIREAHQAGEFVPVDQLNRCVDILSQAIRHFCALMLTLGPQASSPAQRPLTLLSRSQQAGTPALPALRSQH
jgi:acetylornithine deacetylase